MIFVGVVIASPLEHPQWMLAQVLHSSAKNPTFWVIQRPIVDPSAVAALKQLLYHVFYIISVRQPPPANLANELSAAFFQK